MNGIQNLSKKLRKRIQTSVKRLFNSSSTKFDGEFEDRPNKSVSSSHLENYSKIHSIRKKSMSVKNIHSSGDKYKNFKNDSFHDQSSFELENNKLLSSFDKREILTEKNLNVPETTLKIRNSDLVSTKDNLKATDIKCINKESITSSSKSSQSLESTVSDTKLILKCPTGKHRDLKSDEPCICINLNNLELYKNQSVTQEWHKFQSEPTELDELKLKRPPICIQGGQGVVFYVYDEKNARNFALKMKLRDKKGLSSWMIEQRESNILKRIQHNFIVNLYHIHETSGALFMTMEYLDGGCLWSHIAKKGTLPENYTLYYAACVLDALRYLHSLEIVYRDLKAENIVLDGLGRPKLIDFGMAKKLPISENKRNSSKGNSTSVFNDTEKYPATQYYYAAYLAPEIYSKPSTANIFIDSWGLGYIISEILLGYGVFVTMPWENQSNKNEASNILSSKSMSDSEGLEDPTLNKINKTDLSGKFNLTNPHNITMSKVCSDLLRNTLVTIPEYRLSLDAVSQHPFFRLVNWANLIHVRPPDLSVFRRRTKGSGTIRASLRTYSGDKQSMDIFHLTDLQLPDPFLTPSNIFNISNNYAFIDVPSPLDTPINPKAPSIKIPLTHNKVSHRHNFNHLMKYRGHPQSYRSNLHNNSNKLSSQHNPTSHLDTISNLRPSWRI